MNRLIALTSAATLLCVASCTDHSSDEKTPPASTGASAPASREPDNSGVNKRDRGNTTVTPGDQASGSDADRTITAEVRRSITSESGMSVNARNVKIVTIGGVVTLRGPVASQTERDLIESKARAVAGVTSVDNQLEVTNR